LLHQLTLGWAQRTCLEVQLSADLLCQLDKNPLRAADARQVESEFDKELGRPREVVTTMPTWSIRWIVMCWIVKDAKAARRSAVSDRKAIKSAHGR
jgi:hypothetical protein